MAVAIPLHNPLHEIFIPVTLILNCVGSEMTAVSDIVQPLLSVIKTAVLPAHNPIADMLGDGDDSECIYSSFINFGCTYENAINFDESANVDDGSCEYMYADVNGNGVIDIVDVIELINTILDQ